MLRALRVLTVGVDRATGDPVTIMGEVGGSYRLVAVRLDLAGATLIEDERGGSRTSALGLLGRLIRTFDRNLEYIELAEHRDGTFHADLVFDAGTRVAARVGDAIAFALSLDVAVVVEDLVLGRNALRPGSGLDVQDGLELAGVRADDDAAQVERFRRCLDGALPADFTPALP